VHCAKEPSWEADFATAPVERSLMVPASAVVQDNGPHVFVQRTPEVFELRTVKAGHTMGQSIEITTGVREGERIVVRGADKIPRK